jgi:hypothetical protein
MGLEVSYMEFMENELVKVFGSDWNNLTMLELGNQHISSNEKYRYGTGKDYYSSVGFNHISVDINGEDGALPLDLRYPSQFEQFVNKIDVLTNFGTTEHVEPHDTQYECYSILHNCVKLGGLMVHVLPDVYELDQYGAWSGHCTNYYSHEFFKMFAEECGYEILNSTLIRSNRCVILKKILDKPFMSDKELFLSGIKVR